VNRSLLTAALIAIPSGVVTGQEAPVPTGQSCFRGRPLPHCRSFWITEAGYAIRMTAGNSPFESGPSDTYVATLELGRMRNVSDRFAIGLGLGAGTFNAVHLAVKPRVRYWVTRDVALDVSPGWRFNGRVGGTAFTGDASIMFQDRAGVFAHTVSTTIATYSPDTQTPSLRQRLAVLLGVRLGSKLGVAGAIGDGLAAVIAGSAILIYCRRGACS